MELSKNQKEDVVIVSIKGEVDAVTGPDLDNFLKEQLGEQKNFIADFSNVDFISSAGLRVLLAMIKETRQIGGDFRLAGVQEKIYRVLKISGFVGILKIYPDLQAAIESYSE
jgi:anti-anti-sigma factor